MTDRDLDTSDDATDGPGPLAQLGLLGWDSGARTERGGAVGSGRHRASGGARPRVDGDERRRGRVVNPSQLGSRATAEPAGAPSPVEEPDPDAEITLPPARLVDTRRGDTRPELIPPARVDTQGENRWLVPRRGQRAVYLPEDHDTGSGPAPDVTAELPVALSPEDVGVTEPDAAPDAVPVPAVDASEPVNDVPPLVAVSSPPVRPAVVLTRPVPEPRGADCPPGMEPDEKDTTRGQVREPDVISDDAAGSATDDAGMARTPQHSADTARGVAAGRSPSVVGGRETESRPADTGERDRSTDHLRVDGGAALPGDGSAGLLAAAEPRPGESLAELTRRLLEHVDSLDDVEAPGSGAAGPTANGVANGHGAANGHGRRPALLSPGVQEESAVHEAEPSEKASDAPVAALEDPADATTTDTTTTDTTTTDTTTTDTSMDATGVAADATGTDATGTDTPAVDVAPAPVLAAAAGAPAQDDAAQEGAPDAHHEDVRATAHDVTPPVEAADEPHHSRAAGEGSAGGETPGVEDGQQEIDGAAAAPADTEARETSFARRNDPLSGGMTPLLAATPATPAAPATPATATTPATPRRRTPDPLSDPFPADVLGTGVFGMEAFEADPPAEPRTEEVTPPAEVAEPQPEPLLTTPGGGTRTRRREISAANLLPEEAPAPRSGWRRAVYRMTNGAVNPGLSARDQERAEWTERIRSPLAGCHRVAVVSLKGGVGKTTTTVGLGATLASLRGDRVIAVDASPDRGTLGVKVPRTNQLTVRQLLDSRGDIQRYVDVRRFVSQAESRLEVLASDEDPEVSQAFSDEDYRNVDEILERYYSIIVTDCGPGMLHSAMHAVLSLTDTLVVVSTASVDGASSADATLDWLNAHGYADLARNCVTVISTSFAIGPQVDVDLLEKHFASRTREVVRVPYDTHLAGGGFVDLPRLHPTTSDAYLRIAASVVDRFASGS